MLVSGRSLATNIEKAVALGLLERPDNLHTDYAGLPSLPPEKTVILATGTQGEPMSALTRIANGEHKQLSLRSGDTVIMSSRVIPGNARAVSKVINQMYRQGAKVYHDARRTIHATGHACRDELRAVLDTVQPEYFVPVHGEYRHLALHARLAEECGVQSDNILILEDGQPITLTADGCRRDPFRARRIRAGGRQGRGRTWAVWCSKKGAFWAGKGWWWWCWSLPRKPARCCTGRR